MKTKLSISFEAPHLPNGVATILDPVGCGPDVASVIDGMVQDVRMSSAWVKLDEGDPRIATLLQLLAHHGIDADTYDYIEYSEEERQSAPLLLMVPDINERVFGGNEYGTKYEMADACPTCGTGARQTSPLYVWSRHLKRVRQHRAIGCDRGGIILDLGLENKLKSAGATGMSFGDVYGRLENKKRTLVARQQILIDHTLPPIVPACITDPSKTCPTCHRGGIIAQRELHYRRKDLGDIRDFNLTWEWFGSYEYSGNVKDAEFSSPRILVTPKVMNIFREAGVETFQWYPVFADD